MAYDESTAWFRVQLCNLLLVVHCCEERFWLFLAVTFWPVKNFDDLVHSCIKTCCNTEKKFFNRKSVSHNNTHPWTRNLVQLESCFSFKQKRLFLYNVLLSAFVFNSTILSSNC